LCYMMVNKNKTEVVLLYCRGENGFWSEKER